MNTSDNQSFVLRVRLAECERHTVANSKSYAEAEPKAAGRQIRLGNCAVIETNFERAEGRPITGEKIELWIDEFYAGLLDIGSFSSFNDIRLRLPPTTFSHFWIASAGSLGVARDITIYFKAEAEAFQITRVLLVERLTDNGQSHPLPDAADTSDMKWTNVLLGFLVAFVIGAILAAIGHHAGWTLRAVFGHETTFERESREATFVLPARGEPPTAAPEMGSISSRRAAPALQAETQRDGAGPFITAASDRPIVSGK